MLRRAIGGVTTRVHSPVSKPVFTEAQQSRNERSVRSRTMTDVVLVRWPEEWEHIERLRASGTPRLLLVGTEAAAPKPFDALEDWIRLPAVESDVRRASQHAGRPGPSRSDAVRQTAAEHRRGRHPAVSGPADHVVAGGGSTRASSRGPLHRGRPTGHLGKGGVAERRIQPQCARRPDGAPEAAAPHGGSRGAHRARPWLPLQPSTDGGLG